MDKFQFNRLNGFGHFTIDRLHATNFWWNVVSIKCEVLSSQAIDAIFIGCLRLFWLSAIRHRSTAFFFCRKGAVTLWITFFFFSFLISNYKISRFKCCDVLIIAILKRKKKRFLVSIFEELHEPHDFTDNYFTSI